MPAGKSFSARGIEICVEYFKNLGHEEIVVWLPRFRQVGLNRTSRPVRKSGKFSNVRTPDFRFFSFPDSGPLKIEKKSKFFFFQNFFFKFFFHNFFLFIYMVKCLKL